MRRILGSLPVRALISAENLSASSSLPPGASALAMAKPTAALVPYLPNVIAYSRLVPSTSAAILILSNFLPLLPTSNSAPPSITFTTCSLLPTSTLFSKPFSVREPLALPSSTTSKAFLYTS